jgi:hypothetical protein
MHTDMVRSPEVQAKIRHLVRVAEKEKTARDAAHAQLGDTAAAGDQRKRELQFA